MNETQEHKFLRYSLVAVWLVTAATSMWELGGKSAALLFEAGMSDPVAIKSIVLGGALVDLVLGLLLWFKSTRLWFLVALGMMVVMTAIATMLLPTLWLHPLGPLLKNIPIAASLWLLAVAKK